MQQPSTLSSIIDTYDKSKDKLLKLIQYSCLIASWHFENVYVQEKEHFFFLLYKRIFNLRRIFRIGHSIAFIRPILSNLEEVKQKMSFTSVMLLLSNIGKFVFYLVDNISVAIKLMHSKHNDVMRRISFSIFLFANVTKLIHYLIRLRVNFAQEVQIKTIIIQERLTPRQFLKRLAELDEQRLDISLELLSAIGDTIPTIARMNITEIVLRTKIDKGVVGTFGLTSALVELLKQNR